MSDKFQKITVAGILVVEGKYLMVQRSKEEDFLPGYFEFPGGKIDFGESPKEALKREFVEETNLHVEVNGMPIRIFSYITEEGMRHTTELVHKVSLSKDESVNNIKLSHEHNSYKLVSEEEIDSMESTDEMKKNVLAAKIQEK